MALLRAADTPSLALELRRGVALTACERPNDGRIRRPQALLSVRSSAVSHLIRSRSPEALNRSTRALVLIHRGHLPMVLAFEVPS